MTPSVAQNTKYVNLFIGTSGDNGQVAPGAAAPFGMVCVCPDNDPRSHAGYDYAVTKVSGISVNRLSGVGCSGGGGNLRIRPVAPSQELHIKKSREKATPGYYSTAFTNGIKTELTATNAMAVERYIGNLHRRLCTGKERLRTWTLQTLFLLKYQPSFPVGRTERDDCLPYLWQKGTFGGSPYRTVCVKFRTGELGMCPLGKDGLRRCEIPDR